ncbi:MAG: glycosyl hydrolase 108 family protein [Ahrensia sp.]|nr:glycosyl hydrolase 108 family protein [Ahrensia sp.]
MTRFEICQADTAKFEGINSNHPADPGGKTRFGITEAVNREYERQVGARRVPIFEITV